MPSLSALNNSASTAADDANTCEGSDVILDEMCMITLSFIDAAVSYETILKFRSSVCQYTCKFLEQSHLKRLRSHTHTGQSSPRIKSPLHIYIHTHTHTHRWTDRHLYSPLSCPPREPCIPLLLHGSCAVLSAATTVQSLSTHQYSPK